MKVSPLEFRYGREAVKKIFSEEERLKYMLEAEALIAEAEGSLGVIPDWASRSIQETVHKNSITIDKVKEIEKETRHDVMAIIRALTDAAGAAGAFVHFGVTSQDINDTATAMQLKDFQEFLVADIASLMKVLESLVKRYADTPMLGRTHGQHASPITFGLKMAVFLSEMGRHLERVREASKRYLVIKVMGPVGTGAFMGNKALDVQEYVARRLGVGWEQAPTQVVVRDRYVEFLQVIAGVATSLEKFTTEVRNLQRPEIDEISEYFETSSQVGSSAMPSKVNPVDSENVSSISRLIRSLVWPELESAVMWHERDLANSAVERFVIPYSCILVDYVLVKTTSIFSSLRVNTDRMKENLARYDFSMSESLVHLLSQEGVPRQEAHEIIRKASIRARENGQSLKEFVSKSSDFSSIAGEKVEKAFMPENFLGVSGQICSNVISHSRELRKSVQEKGGD